MQKVNSQLKLLTYKVDNFDYLKSTISDMQELITIAESESDKSLITQLNAELKNLLVKVKDFFIKTLLSGEYDNSNAIIKINSGAGGTEACDWVNMLYNMYFSYAEKNGYKVRVLDSLDGDGAGYKSITFMVIGKFAYGYLKGETGVHRLVRISPFDASKRRHTSFAAVEVMPELNDDIAVQLKDSDLKIDTFRASGAGGQHVNTTDSAVRITHLPSGIVVTCQNQRSQLQNRETAKKILAGKLVAFELQKQLQKAASLKGEVKKIEWGSQIRSYVFCPYTLVKDVRTGYETSDISAVMSGNLNDFIVSYLKNIR